MEKIYLGSKVRVTDPCYDEDVWCVATVENVLPGFYRCYVDPEDEGDWGRRIASITVVNDDHFGGDWENEYEIGVDSGQAGIFDYEYWLDHKDEQSFEDETQFYGKCCKLTLSEEGAGTVDGKGFVSSSGYGDGCYDIAVKRDKNGYIVAIKIIFIDKEADEEEDW